jgi:hypothetical protein
MCRPANPKELFNLRHASARNVIERVFGVMKNRFEILNRLPKYSKEIQFSIPVALLAVQNFIRRHKDDVDSHLFSDASSSMASDDASSVVASDSASSVTLDDEPSSDDTDYVPEPVDKAETARAKARRDSIARRMWEGYVRSSEFS